MYGTTKVKNQLVRIWPLVKPCSVLCDVVVVGGGGVENDVLLFRP